MAALRKKILEKKAAEQRRNPPVAVSQSPPPPPPAARAVVPAAATPSIKTGFLGAGGDLYPDGSSEAAPTCWRKGSTSTRAKVFELLETAQGYEVRGAFNQAGRFLGKEDFEVTRSGFSLCIRGHPDADAQSLVAGLDETITLPGDADWTKIAAEYRNCALS